MPTGAQWLVFLGSTALFALLPGPGMLYVLARSLRGGRTEGLRSSVGNGLGMLVHIAAASVGLSAILAASAQAFTVVKILGGLYLVFLGLQAILRREPAGVPTDSAKARRNAIVQGVFTEALNPKTALFFLAFLPHFVHPGPGVPIPLVFVLLGLVVLAMNVATDVLVSIFAGALGRKLAAHPRWYRRQRVTSGMIMVGAGTVLAVAEQN